MTLKIDLVDMPFSSLSRPSIGLTQLKAVTQNRFCSDVSVNINYLSHEFGQLFGKEAYELISDSKAGHVTGLGEWIFRQVAFPALADNSTMYFKRFGRQMGRKNIELFERDINPVRLRLTEIIDSLIEKYNLQSADIVGLTTMFFQNLPSIALARRLRKFNSRQIIVMGGANCEAEMGMEWARQVEEIDFVFSGHSLVSFPELVQHVLAGDVSKCDGIKGVFSRRNINLNGPGLAISPENSGENKYIDRGNPAFWKAPELDINEAVELDYDDYFRSADTVLKKIGVTSELPFETSRGCWWGEKAHCTFCGLNGGDMAYRAMEPGIAASYIDNLLDRYAGRTQLFECVDNIMPREYFESVFRDLRPPAGVEFFYEVKADLTERQISILKNSHVTKIQPGIESLSTTTLKAMRKGTSAFGNIKLLLNCKKYGIQPSWNLLIGFPGEAKEVYEAYLDFLPSLFHLEPPSGVFPVRFDRFSPYFMNPEKYGLQLEPYEYYSYCTPFERESIKNIAYYFQDLNIDAQYIVDMTMAFSDLGHIVKQWQERWAAGARMGKPSLTLVIENRHYWVIDSRTEKTSKIPITDDEFEVLKASIDPVESAPLAAIYPDAVMTVFKKGLAFRERGRMMCIVSDVDREKDIVERPLYAALGA